MRRETVRRLTVLIIALTFVSVPIRGAQAESSSIREAVAVRQISPEHLRLSRPMFGQIPQRHRCNVKRRALAGAAIGAIIAMVAARKAAEAHDSSVGAKGTLHAGGVGAAIGVFVGLRTCR